MTHDLYYRVLNWALSRDLFQGIPCTQMKCFCHTCVSIEQVKTLRKCRRHFARQTHQLAPKWWSKGRGGRMDEWVAVRKGKWARDRGDGSQNKEVLSHQDKDTGALIRKHLQIQIQVRVDTGTYIITAPEAKECGKI